MTAPLQLTPFSVAPLHFRSAQRSLDVVTDVIDAHDVLLTYFSRYGWATVTILEVI